MVTIDLNKAKEITKEQDYAKRESLLQALDVEFQRALGPDCRYNAIVAERESSTLTLPRWLMLL